MEITQTSYCCFLFPIAVSSKTKLWWKHIFVIAIQTSIFIQIHVTKIHFQTQNILVNQRIHDALEPIVAQTLIKLLKLRS